MTYSVPRRKNDEFRLFDPATLGSSRAMTGIVMPADVVTPPRAATTHTLPLRIERITESDLSGPLQADWQALHDTLCPRTPFTSPLWNSLWWKHFHSNSGAIRNELFAHTVRDPWGRLIGVSPMMATECPSFGPVRMRALRGFGADPNITELRSLVCAPHDEVQVFRSLRDHVTNIGRRFDWVDWGAMRQQHWQSAANLLEPSAVISGATITDHHLSLPATWDEFRAARSRNIKESIRKCHNSLKRDGHAAQLRVVSSPADCADGIRTFLELHARRSAAEDTISHPNVFASQRAQAFLLEYAQSLAQRDQLRVFQLLIDQSVVATRVGFLYGDELYLYYSGYDTKWAHYSVMTRLVVEVIKWAIDGQLSIVNLSTGNDVSKLRWSPTPTHYRYLTEVMPGLGSRLSFATYRFLKGRARHTGLQAAETVSESVHQS